MDGASSSSSSSSSSSTTTTTTTSSQKISIFGAASAAAKSGFVIPKNKLSGSLVPVFQKQQHGPIIHRITKWGTDLTHDPQVTKGKALALQIRVHQITKQLESGILEAENTQDLNPDKTNSDTQINIMTEILQLEKREAIGEILKLDPSYKPPPGFKPLFKEATVPLPVQEYPGYNFIGLIYGPEGDNQKRLEKETGAKIKVYGTKADTGEKGEIKPGADNKGSYDEMHVNVSADSFDKVDVAVSIIELLITSVIGNLAANSTPAVSVSEDSTNVLSQSKDGSPSHAVSVALANQAMVQPGPAAVSQIHGDHFQYSGPWFSAVPSHAPVFVSSANIATPNPSGLTGTHFPSQTLNPASMASTFGAQPGFHPTFPNQHVSMQAPLPRQISQHSHITQASPLGHIGPPRNPSIIYAQNLSAPRNASPIGQPQISMPSAQNSAPVAGKMSLGLSNMGPMPPPATPVSLHQQLDIAFKPPQSNMSMMPRSAAFPTHQAGFPLGLPSSLGSMPRPPTHSSVNHLSGPGSFPLRQQSGIPNSASRVAPYHTNVKPPILMSSNSGNFTFHSQRPNTEFQFVSIPNSQATQELPPSGPQPLPFGFPRTQVPNQVDQTQARASTVPFAGRSGSVSIPPRNAAFPYAGQSPIPQMGMKNFISAPQMPTLPNPGVPRSMHIQHNYPAQRPWTLNQKFGSNHTMASGKPAYPVDQIYDPFSPTSVATPQQKGNPGK
ncbi:PREDICTED: branchpoint-bridging protein [Lupinus angustifolius]|uniref:branchpoint-bridging protein n=1 Tax=Lupinus angustifolius TaxID=3871 RepID=UPI00092FC2B4|nr:PREDICTED: branchpoint-bridging protein [Lupinus angustifolius]